MSAIEAIGFLVAVAICLTGCHSASGAGGVPVSKDPLGATLVLRSNGDFLKAQAASQSMLGEAFKRVEAGLPLTEADRTNLLRGARLCAAMAAYLPGKAEMQDFKCGEALAALGYHDEAIHRYELFLNLAGDNPTDNTMKVVRADAYGLMSASLTATGKYKPALEAANTALKAFPHTAAYLIDRGVAEIKLGNAATARTDLTEAAGTAAIDDPAKQKAEKLLKTLKAKK